MKILMKNLIKQIGCFFRGLKWSLEVGWPINNVWVSGHVHELFGLKIRDDETIWMVDKCAICNKKIKAGWVKSDSPLMYEHIKNKKHD